MARSASFRQSLFRNMELLFALVSGSIFAVTLLGAGAAIRTLSGADIHESIARVDGQLRGFFDLVESQLRVARAWGEPDLLRRDHPERLVSQLAPIIEAAP